ncbi:MAG: response regulator transcription factor [Paludibaculum sp.]
MAAIASSMPQASWTTPELRWNLRPAKAAIRVLTVDAHPLVREGLAAVINKADGMAVVAEAATGEEALEVYRRMRPDVVTLDLQLPDMPGDSVARRILEEYPTARVVVITGLQGDAHMLRALEAGVKGLVLKGMPNAELLDVIRQVHAGRKAIPREVASALADHLGEETLTPREVQVLRLVARGNRNKEVAAHLSIADETVRMHMKNILSKLAANDRTHAVTIALTRGFIAL